MAKVRETTCVCCCYVEYDACMFHPRVRWNMNVCRSNEDLGQPGGVIQEMSVWQEQMRWLGSKERMPEVS